MSVSDKVGCRWRVDVKLNRGTLELDLLVIRVTQLRELESVMATTFGLHGELPTGASESLGNFPRWFIIAL